MLRINLLPGYVRQRRLTKRLVAGFSALLIVLVAALLAYNFIYQLPKAASLERQASDAEAKQTATNAIKTQAQNEIAKVAPIQAKLDFVKAVHVYNAQWPALYASISHYLAAANSHILYSDASVSGTMMTLKAYTPSATEAGRFYLAMLNEAALPNSLFSAVNLDQAPGYPDVYVNKYYLNGHLVGIGSSPVGGGGSSGQGGYSGSSGQSGYPGGSGQGGYSGSSGQIAQTGGGPAYGADRIQSVVTPTVTSLDTILAGMVNPLAPPEEQNAEREALKQRIVTKREQKGYALTVTLTLKGALTPPAFPPTGSTGGGASGGPGGPGGPGGYPGGMPGGRPGYPGGQPG